VNLEIETFYQHLKEAVDWRFHRIYNDKYDEPPYWCPDLEELTKEAAKHLVNESAGITKLLLEVAEKHHKRGRK